MPDASTPISDDISRPYWEAAEAGELRLQKCGDCGHIMFPPAPQCSECLASYLEWRQMSGRGTVVSFIVYHRAWQPAFADQVPYNVAIIELEEDPQIISAVTGCGLDEIAVGMSVAVTFETERGLVLPRFAPWSPNA